MGEHILVSHVPELVTQEATYKTGLLPLLAQLEQSAFNILKHHNGRLEQERTAGLYNDRFAYFISRGCFIRDL